MPIYLCNVGGDGGKSKAVEYRLRAAIPDLVAIADIAEVLSRRDKREAGPAYVAVVLPGKDRRVFAEITDFATRHRDRLFLILISEEISLDDYKTVTRTGAADWVSADADPQEILDIIRRGQTRAIEARSERSSERRTVAVAFVPSAGGVGNTTLAAETGVHLKLAKATRELRVCLIDLNFQRSNVCDYLDIEPRLQIQEISTDPQRLDAQLFDIFVSHHASGLDVFAAPRSTFDYCDLDVSALDNLFSMAAARYDLMLIDLPVVWLSWSSKVIAASDAALVVGLNSVPGLRQTVDTLAAIRAIPQTPAQIVVALNRCQRRLVGGIARRQHVETALGREQVFYVGEEPMAIESINTGSPMAMNKSYRAIGKDIAALAGFCAGLTSIRAEQG